MNGVFRRPRINSTIVPEPGDRLRGDIVQGKVVYVETTPNLISRVQRDPLNPEKELWVRDPRTNEPLYPKFEVVQDGVLERAYVHQDIGNGVVYKNYDFEPSEDDLRRQQPRPESEAMTKADVMQAMEAMARRIAELESAFEPEGADGDVEILEANPVEEKPRGARKARSQK